MLSICACCRPIAAFHLTWFNRLVPTRREWILPWCAIRPIPDDDPMTGMDPQDLTEYIRLASNPQGNTSRAAPTEEDESLVPVEPEGGTETDVAQDARNLDAGDDGDTDDEENEEEAGRSEDEEENEEECQDEEDHEEEDEEEDADERTVTLGSRDTDEDDEDDEDEDDDAPSSKRPRLESVQTDSDGCIWLL